MISEGLQRLRDVFPILEGLNDWQTAAAIVAPFLLIGAAMAWIDRR